MAEPFAQLLLFGPIELRLENRVVVLPTRKLLALLAYLSLEGPTSRSRLAELLWDRADDRARANLRGELYRLKKTAFRLEDRGERLALTGVSSDIENFERRVAQGDWAGALTLRRGALLEGFALQDAIEFETWLALTRERWEERYDEALGASAGGLERDGNADGALETHRQLLSRDPLREDSHRAVMRLLVQASEPAQALEHYQRFAAFLEREMGLEPSVAMQEFVRAITVGSRRPNQPEPAVPPTPKGLNTPPLVGRESAWAELAREPVGLALIVGEAGVGKTRLATDFAYAKGSSLVVPHRELAAQVGFGGLIEGLRTHFEAGWRPRDLEPIWRTEAARLLPELADGEAAPGADGTDEARFREGLARTLLNTLQPGGAILMDDLQWADESTLRFLPYLVRRAARTKVRVIGTTRPEGLEPGGWLGRAVRELEREGLNQRVQLAPLEETDVLKLVRDLSGSQGGTVFSERLHAATQGNAFYVLETLRALFERGELKADTDGWHTPYDEDTHDYTELRLPESVLESVRQRFYRLEELPRRVAELLALSGRDLDPSTLEQAAQGSSAEVLEALEVLEQTGLVRGAASGYRLAHDLSRAALDEGLSTARRLTLHARLCEVLSNAPSEPGLATEVLRHAQAAGNWVVARDWAERAAREAITRYAHREVADLLALALEAHARLGFDPEREAQLRFDREEALHWLGEHESREQELRGLEPLLVGNTAQRDRLEYRRGRLAEARGQLEQAARAFGRCQLPEAKLALIRVLSHFARGETARATALELFQSAAPEHAVQAALALALMDQERGAHAEAQSWLERAQPLADHDPRARLEVLRVSARHANLTGHFEEAETLAVQAQVLAQSMGATEIEASCTNHLGLSFLLRGRYTEAALSFERVAEYGERLDRPQFRISSAINLSWVRLLTADFERSLESATVAFDLASRINDRGGVIEALLGTGFLELYQNQPKKARARFETAIEHLEANSPPHYLADANSGLGMCALRQGNVTEARDHLRVAASLKRAHPRMTPWMGDQAQLALCLWLDDDRLEALRLSEEALGALHGSGLDFPQRVPWIHAQLLHQRGDAAETSVWLERTRGLLEETTAAVPEARQQRYLETFRFNRDILAALNGVWPDPPRLL